MPTRRDSVPTVTITALGIGAAVTALVSVHAGSSRGV